MDSGLAADWPRPGMTRLEMAERHALEGQRLALRIAKTGALAGRSINNQSPVLKRMILALIGIPIWLIIVLLSPLDAYAAVRNLARQA